MSYQCFMQDCELEAQYVCFCLGSQTYSCQFHLLMHLKLPNRVHNFDSVLVEPNEKDKSAILEFLVKEKSKKEELKKIALAVNRQCCQAHKDSIDENLRMLDSDLSEISSLIEKITKLPEKEESSPENPVIAEQSADAKKDKEILIKDSELYRSVSLFCELGRIRYKRFELINRVNNEREIEQDFRRTCLLYEKHATNPLFSQAYQEYINAYQKTTSTYLFPTENEKANLFIYDTESEKEELKVLEIKPQLRTNFVQLPNSELFLINSGYKPKAYIIDKNYRTQYIPSVTLDLCYTCIYFNRNVYCFVSWNYSYNNPIYMRACRFDLTEYRWVMLAGIEYNERHNDQFLSVTFNGNILISSFKKGNLWLYSIDIDSFSEIPYRILGGELVRKMIFNVEDRLYLIECSGCIYESEIGNEYVWNKIARSIGSCPFQVSCSYNKGGLYISKLVSGNCTAHYRFDLSQKSLIEIACYGKSLALKRLDGKIKAIEHYGQGFKFNSEHASACIQKKSCLYRIVKNLEGIEEYSKSNADTHNILYKGDALRSLGRYLEALDCYNVSIKLGHENGISLLRKASTLYYLGRYLEALECHDELITLDPRNGSYCIEKADCLYDLGRYDEALELYSKWSERKDCPEYFYIRKADTLHRMGKNLKAAKYFNKSIELKPDNHLYFCYHANMLNDIGDVTEAIQEFYKAYGLFSMRERIYSSYQFFSRNFGEILIDYEDIFELLKMICKLLESTLEFKEKVEKIKYSNIKNLEILYEIEEKEKVIKEKNSQVLIRAVKCLDIARNKSIEAFEEMKIEISEHQKEIIDAVTQLSLLISRQD